MRTHVRAQLEEQRRAIVSATGDALLRSNERVRAIAATYLPTMGSHACLAAAAGCDASRNTE
jgi:hypothetical protein